MSPIVAEDIKSNHQKIKDLCMEYKNNIGDWKSVLCDLSSLINDDMFKSSCHLFIMNCDTDNQCENYIDAYLDGFMTGSL